MSSEKNLQLKCSGRRHILYDATLIEHPDETLFFPDSIEKNTAIGRGEAQFYQYQGLNVVLKQYLRGGMVARILGDRYFGINYEHSRSYKEFRLLHQMQALELPAPIPVAAKAERSGLFFRAALVTREIPNAQTLADQLMRAALEESTWLAVGRCIRQFHNHDVYHADLNARNILLSKGKIYLIDFDKGMFRYLGESWKASNLARLKRSLMKFKSLNQTFYFDDNNWKQLIQGYSEN